MKFTKLHGAGNDFIVVDARDQSRDWSKLAIAICDRHTGVGADGLLTVNASEVAA
ncbi:MAG: diaminopimelate epimerase, partial [Chloroflexi bacterium]|nr:diaminopimelate epimerase [Chloroflexota bacterium]